MFVLTFIDSEFFNVRVQNTRRFDRPIDCSVAYVVMCGVRSSSVGRQTSMQTVSIVAGTNLSLRMS